MITSTLSNEEYYESLSGTLSRNEFFLNQQLAQVYGYNYLTYLEHH